MKRSHKFLLAAALAALAAPVVAWASFAPVRILAPTLIGVTCQAAVCVEDATRFAEATRLQHAALAAVARKLGPLDAAPTTVFCSTRACYHAFGGGMERGATLFDWGVILPPESWVPHIVEHEYIHMLQAQRLGLWGRQATPEWFREGMAFHVSEPPAYDLPAYALPFVSRYQAWETRVGRDNVWSGAPELESP